MALASAGKRAYDGYTGLKDAPAAKRGPAAADAAAAQEQWMYVDASKQLQGPYPLSSMREWFAQGFLPLETRVRRVADNELYTLRQCQEIAGRERAEPRTADQWKVAGNEHMAAGRLEKAVDAYDRALGHCDNPSVDPKLRGAVLSNRSGAQLLLGNADAAAADARLCVAERPDWAKAHWRLAVALLSTAKSTDWSEDGASSNVCENWRRLNDALDAADRAEKLDPTTSHTETKNAAIALLRADAVGDSLETAGTEQQQEEREGLLKRFRSAQEDTDLRLRCKRVAEQEARDKEAVERGLDGTGEAWRKESAAEYTARRARLALLEKIDRAAAAAGPKESIGHLTKDHERSELEKAEIVDEQLAHSQQHATILRR